VLPKGIEKQMLLERKYLLNLCRISVQFKRERRF